MPCFNAEAHVREAIQSAVDQTYPQTEVIVVDDGSTDSSLGIVQSFGDRVRWTSGPNRGAAAARNTGLAMATGDLVQFHDCDDLLLPGKLERQVEAMIAGRADIVFCDWEMSREGDGRAKIHRPPYDGSDPVVFLLKHTLSGIAPLHWRRNLVAVGGWREDLPCSQEFDLHMRLACCGLTFAKIPEVLFRARLRRGSISGDYNRVMRQYEKILPDLYVVLQAGGKMDDARARAFAGRMARAARHLLQRGDRTRADEYFRVARSMHREGGLAAAYSPFMRCLCRILGPVLAERLVQLRRKPVGWPTAG